MTALGAADSTSRDIRIHSEYAGGMTTTAPDTVTFSDLSRNPRAVAERAARLGRVRVTHRDAPDFYLTAADREELREENLSTAARLFTALMKQDAGAHVVHHALADVFPWVRHLGERELEDFARELVAALSDAAELEADANVHEVLAGWRATARIKADKSEYAKALLETSGNFGPVEVSA